MKVGPSLLLRDNALLLYRFETIRSQRPPTTGETEQFNGDITRIVLYFVAVSCGTFCASFIHVSSWMANGERQCRKIRMAYFEAMMKQDASWFDQNETGALSSRLAR